MTHRELIHRIARRSYVTKRTAARMVQAFGAALVGAAQRGERLNVAGVGVFTVRRRKARRIRNPVTGETIQLPETLSIGFRASSRVLRGVRR